MISWDIVDLKSIYHGIYIMDFSLGYKGKSTIFSLLMAMIYIYNWMEQPGFCKSSLKIAFIIGCNVGCQTLPIPKLCWTSFRARNPPGSTNVRAVLIIVLSPVGYISEVGPSTWLGSGFPYPVERRPRPLPSCPEGAACDAVANPRPAPGGSPALSMWMIYLIDRIRP